MAKAEGDSLVTLPAVAAAILTYWIVATAYNFLRAPQPPTTIPWMGYGKGWLAGLRNYTALKKSKEWLLAGYDKYSRKNQIFVLPATLGMQPEIVMPRTQLSWMFDQPDHILSTSEAHYDSLQGDFSFVKPIILKDPYHEHVIHKNLVRNLNAVLPSMEDEIPHAVEAVYGMNTEEFIKVEALQSFMKMIPGLTNRMLVGKSLCREQKFLDAVLAFTTDVIRTQAFMSLLPKALHPILGNLLSLPVKYHYWQSSQWTLPLIKRRISDITKKDAGDPDYDTWKEPSDFITWSYRTAQAEGRRDEMQPDRIAQRIMPINFASIHTTSLTAYETLGSILWADASVISSLREEAHRIFKEEGGWTKQGLSRMHRIDSAIRESQRASPIALTFVHRKVVAKEGITTPEGIHLAHGVLLSCPWTALAGDTDIHENSEVFDAFRYSRPREEFEAMSTEEKANVNALKLKQTGLVTTGVHHLPFGHGRHACPGRFFVSHELKMIFAHLLLNYDFKPLTEKPKKIWMIRFQIPLPLHVEVRRRKSIWTPEDRT
ncbi:cytochrome P450 [Cucurbitaria berberidis CBS 394.84]|uniref:Cytochrome P450 n=1 Tax=Cucurbitaria berberidis CBS 394.84 TaxID=1168544 RepID=A0A9P4GKU4_9PLEO|nr:cytochrome P450 [Cucurbitaria berberidis CBS 394.84]KAF1848178.1 cytochrome P450 [Cucurbitaria berberidis CBS 394.84]